MKRAYINGVILDGTENMEPQRDRVIITDGDRISAIVDRKADLSGCELVDLGGSYIMPGLVDLHIHIPSSGKPKKGGTDYKKLEKLLNSSKLVVKGLGIIDRGLIRQELMGGTTTVRALGGVFHLDTELRDMIDAGRLTGPRILASDYAVSVPGGHMTGTVALAAHSVEEAVAMVDDLHAHGVDQIKLMITGGVLDAEVPGEPGTLKMPEEYVKAAVERAHGYGLTVAAHVEGTEGMVIALRNGVDTIEHGGKPSEEAIRLFKETGATLTATLSPAAQYSALEERPEGMSEIEYLNGKALFANMVECIKACREAGVRVGIGTDTGCPYVAHYDTWRELYWYHKFIGVSNREALHTATQVNAEILGRGDVFGTIEPGKSADMIVTEGDPLEDLRALRKVTKVVFRGELIEKPAVKRYAAADAALDKLM
ncbi:MAG: amidohydrolase family protein [Firmicutes bacterium]|nr:amidohydrolase family protein [Bacillota bacterium]